MADTDTKTKNIQPYKLEAVATLKELFETANDYIFTNYRGLTVEQITNLRNKLRENNAEYKVIKNRFAKIALNQMEKPELGDILTGPTAVALSKDETGPVAKALISFGEEFPLEIKGALIEDQLFDQDQVIEFSKLPTKSELYAKLMATMNAPIQKFASTLHAVPQKLARVLQAVAEKKEAEGQS
jgi:large subunit ribosomal protein L10